MHNCPFHFFILIFMGTLDYYGPRRSARAAPPPLLWGLAPTFKKNGDIRNCNCHRTVKLLKHGMKVVERALEKIPQRIVTANERQVNFKPEKGTTDVFILRRRQEEYHARRKKLNMFC